MRGNSREKKNVLQIAQMQNVPQLRENIHMYECMCMQSGDKVIYCRYCLTFTSLCFLRSRPLPDYIVNNYREIHVTAECMPQPFSSSMALLIPLFIS